MSRFGLEFSQKTEARDCMLETLGRLGLYDSGPAIGTYLTFDMLAEAFEKAKNNRGTPDTLVLDSRTIKKLYKSGK